MKDLREHDDVHEVPQDSTSQVVDPDDGLPLTPRSALRRGDYKLIFDWHGALHLYYIALDRDEKQDLANAMPELAEDMFRQLSEWLDTNVEARYFPKLNTNHNSEKDERSYPFQDLRSTLTTSEATVRPAAE